MSDNDSVRREEVLNHLGDLFTLCSETGSITERDLESFEKIIKSLSPVPQEMSAREYLQTMRPICEDGRNCGKCPLSYNNNGKGINCQDYAAYYPKEAVATVERWARERSQKNENE